MLLASSSISTISCLSRQEGASARTEGCHQNNNNDDEAHTGDKQQIHGFTFSDSCVFSAVHGDTCVEEQPPITLLISMTAEFTISSKMAPTCASKFDMLTGERGGCRCSLED